MNSMGRIAVIDAQVSGISGDMLLSSLVDAGANKKRVTAADICVPKISQGKQHPGGKLQKKGIWWVRSDPTCTEVSR